MLINYVFFLLFPPKLVIFLYLLIYIDLGYKRAILDFEISCIILERERKNDINR